MHSVTQDRRRISHMGTLLLVLTIAAFPILVFAWRRSLDTIFFALTGDDFHRTLNAWKVLQGELFPSRWWPPLQFWIEALALRVYPYILSIPYLVNLAASTGALVCLVCLGKALNLGRRGLFLTVILAATMPWFVWLSVSGLAEPLFFLFITLSYFGVALWRGRERELGLWLAALGLLAAGMLRFDGWGHSVAFSIAVVWLWWRERRPQAVRWLLAAVVPWLFPVVWLGFQYAEFGDPFRFSSVTRNYWLDMQHTLDFWTRLSWQPKDLWAVAGFTLPVAIAGLWLMRRRRGMALLAAMWLASFALLMASTLNYTISQAQPTRMVVVHALLLMPPAALALQKVSERGWIGSVVVIAFVGILVISRVAALPSYPSGLAEDVAQVGEHVNHLRAEGQIQPGEQIMIQVIYWDHHVLNLLTGDPGAVVYDRDPSQVAVIEGQYVLDDVTNPSELALSGDELQAELGRQGVRIVIAHTEWAVEHLRSMAQETLHAGRFHVFVLP